MVLEIVERGRMEVNIERMRRATEKLRVAIEGKDRLQKEYNGSMEIYCVFGPRQELEIYDRRIKRHLGWLLENLNGENKL